MTEIIQYTNIHTNEDKREVLFTINDKSKYKIPSRMFPISDKKSNTFFTKEMTVPYENLDFFNLLNQIELPMGHCYSNSEKIRQIAERLNIQAHYFSGWIIKAGDMPKHHAWIIIEHENGYSIVDSLKDKIFTEAYKRSPINYDDVNWRRKHSLSVKEVIKDMPLNSQQIIIGQTPDSILYVGSPDTLENARKIFNDLTKMFPNHPSYMGEGDNMNGRSKLQEELKNIGIE